MRKIAIGALILFAIIVLIQDIIQDKRKNSPLKPRPYVVMLSLDGFRYDYADKTNTPAFDSIEKFGVRAKGLQPVFPSLTFPNHYSIATGLYAGNHGLVANNFLTEDMNLFYSPANRQMVENGSFYLGEPIWVTAEAQRVKSASYFWVGTEAKIKGYQPSIWKKYDGKVSYPDRMDSVISWLNLPYKNRPHLITCYSELTDNVGHHSGPESIEIVKSITYVDSLIADFTRKLTQTPVADSVNFIIVSDHGMAQLDSAKVVYLDNYIKKQWIDTLACSTPFCLLYTQKHCDDSVINALKGVEGIEVWRKNEIPERYHLVNDNRLGDVVISAKLNWSIKVTNDGKPLYQGAHGFDNADELMHGIFYAIGPSFKQGYAAPVLQNIDIYNLLCQILEIKPAENDGKMERIEGVLK